MKKAESPEPKKSFLPVTLMGRLKAGIIIIPLIVLCFLFPYCLYVSYLPNLNLKSCLFLFSMISTGVIILLMLLFVILHPGILVCFTLGLEEVPIPPSKMPKYNWKDYRCIIAYALFLLCMVDILSVIGFGTFLTGLLGRYMWMLTLAFMVSGSVLCGWCAHRSVQNTPSIKVKKEDAVALNAGMSVFMASFAFIIILLVIRLRFPSDLNFVFVSTAVAMFFVTVNFMLSNMPTRKDKFVLVLGLAGFLSLILCLPISTLIFRVWRMGAVPNARIVLTSDAVDYLKASSFKINYSDLPGVGIIIGDVSVIGDDGSEILIGPRTSSGSFSYQPKKARSNYAEQLEYTTRVENTDDLSRLLLLYLCPPARFAIPKKYLVSWDPVNENL